MKRYPEFHAQFRWDVPSHFNFATDVVDRWAREKKEGPALIWENAAGEERQYSFPDMSRLSKRFANVLLSCGVGKGDRIIVMLPRLPEWMVAMVGALRIGAVPVPCIEMLTARDVDYRVRNSEARAVICRAAQVDKFSPVVDGVPCRIAIGGAPGWRDYETEMQGAGEAVAPVRVEAEDPAIMYYTSGSTGHPKAVVHASRAIFAWRVSAIYWLDLKPSDRMWCTADTGWSKAGTSILFGPWSCGAASLFYDGGFSSRDRLRLLAKHRITVYCAPGTELYRLVDEPIADYDLSALRRVVSAGEAVSSAIAERWERASGIRVDEAYGQTETLMTVLNYPVSR